MKQINWTHVLIAIALGAALMHFYGTKTAGGQNMTRKASGGRT